MKGAIIVAKVDRAEITFVAPLLGAIEAKIGIAKREIKVASLKRNFTEVLGCRVLSFR
jgi:hypothetical protein